MFKHFLPAALVIDIGIALRREEAVAVVKELLDSCTGLDGHSLEIAKSTQGKSMVEGYQITIRGVLDSESKTCINTIISGHRLVCQVGSIWRTKHSINRTEPDTFIIYRDHHKP